MEIFRAPATEFVSLLVDNSTIELEPRYFDQVFEILDDPRRAEDKTFIMIEQNADTGLEFADIGYVLVSGQLAKAGGGDELLDDPEVGRPFLGG